jgi:hypothetical protein
MTYVLWTGQVLLTLLFVFTGGTMLVLPLEVLTQQTPLSGWFVRFLSVAEVLGAVGLILTGLVGVRPGLTPLAALWAGRDYGRRDGARLGGGRARRRSRASADPAGGGAPLG